MRDEMLEKYVRLYRKTVFGTAMCFVKNPCDADDIAQEVFLKLYTHEGSFDSDEHVRAWLIRCAVNLCKSLLRSYRYRFSVPLEAAENAAYPDSTDSTALTELLQTLSKRNRAAVYLHYYAGYSAAETAQILGISESAVMARLSRGRKQLRAVLQEERNENNDGFQKLI